MSTKADISSTGPINGRPPDSEQYVPFDLSRYPDGAYGSMYMSMSSSPPRYRNHVCKHQKKKGQHSRRTNPNKLDSLLLDCQINSIYHSLQYDRKQSRSDKSSAGSNHTSHKKHHDSSHLNPSIGSRRYAAKMKKEGGGVVNSVSQVNSELHESTIPIPKQNVSPTLPVQKAYSFRVKTKRLNAILDAIPEAKTMLAWKIARDKAKPVI